MRSQGSIRSRRRKRGDGTVRLNITSMIDMFTLMVVFLLKNYSSEGQMVTPAKNLTLPMSSVERMAKEAQSVKISSNSIQVEDKVVIDPKAFQTVNEQKDFMIKPLFDVLSENAKNARNMAKAVGEEFSGKISIQADVEIPYNILTRVMYTCGQAGFPVMNLVVYRKE